MGKVRHGVAGYPIEHSLSPVLTAIVHAHLSRTDGVELPGLKGVVVIPTEGVENDGILETFTFVNVTPFC